MRDYEVDSKWALHAVKICLLKFNVFLVSVSFTFSNFRLFYTVCMYENILFCLQLY